MKALSKVLIVLIIPSVSLITSGCQKLNMHSAPREDMYFSVPDHIPELEQKVQPETQY